jgi:hypothetical protein
MKKYLFLPVLGILFTTKLLFPLTAHAVCPICTVAVGAGLGLSRYFGIDDLITGIWVGGLIISVSLWTVDWLIKKNFRALKIFADIQIKILSFAFWIILTYPPLMMAGIIGNPFNTVWGVDKLIMGSFFGAIAFAFGVLADKKARKLYGKQFFNFQKVIFPVLSLLIFSILMYFYGGYLK